MPPGWHSILNRASLIALLIMLGTLAGCFEQRLDTPTLLRAPYGESQLWAVAPFLNESGNSLVETFRISDLFVEQVQQVRIESHRVSSQGGKAWRERTGQTI